MRKISLCITLMLGVYYTSVSSAAQVGQSLPIVRLPDVRQDKVVDLHQWQGKVVYLDFWASWCAPCKVSFPALNALHNALKDKGFEVVAVNLDEDKAKAEQFLKEIPVDFTVLRDGNGELADKLVIESMPTSFILDKQGVIRHIHQGFDSSDIATIKANIDGLLQLK